MRRRARLIVVLITMLVLLCGTSAGLLLSAPRAPRTHRENIAAVLARHGVAFQSITFTQSFEESSELDFYRAQVQVYASDGSVASGWIGCEDRDRVCFLELRALGIVGERLPDLADDPFAPWLARAQAELKRLGLVR